MGKILTSAARCGEGFMEEREEIASSQCCLGKGNIRGILVLEVLIKFVIEYFYTKTPDQLSSQNIVQASPASQAG